MRTSGLGNDLQMPWLILENHEREALDSDSITGLQITELSGHMRRTRAATIV